MHVGGQQSETQWVQWAWGAYLGPPSSVLIAIYILDFTILFPPLFLLW